MLKLKYKIQHRPSLFAMLLAFTPASFTAANSSQQVIGQAYEPGSDNLLYEERHRNQARNGHTVEYSSPTGELIATKSLEYSTRSYQPSFTLSNKLTGEELSVDTNAQSLVLEARNSGALTTKTMSVDESLVIDAGFVNFLISHWQKLDKGETLNFHFLLPDHLKAYPLRAFEIDCGEDKMCVRISLKNRLLALFSSDINLEFDRTNQNLLRYQGRSNIAFADGTYPLVDIRYHYF